jgi:hypothetical protein
MEKKKLDTVTLLGIDGINIDRLILAAEICKKDFEFGAVKLLTSLHSGHHDVVPIVPITSVEAYSEFVVKDLHAYIDTSHLLMIQYDGFILNPAAWSDEFLEYDYIGAPWFVLPSHLKDGFPVRMVGKWIVGNGGFSLKSKKFLLACAELARENMFPKYHPVDVVTCAVVRDLLEAKGIRFAPVEVAKKFSFEANAFMSKWDQQFGYHGTKWTDISAWSNHHPEYVVDMKAGTVTKVDLLRA